MAEIKRRFNGKISLWGGVNGFVIVDIPSTIFMLRLFI